MEKLFNCLTWNIENFGSDSRDENGHLKPYFKAKVLKVVNEIKSNDPDIFAIFEVRSTDVFEEFMEHFRGYSFYITEGPQSQEILLAVRGTFTSFITQRIEFKSGNQMLRPGMLLTVVIDDVKYSLLFVHLKSLKDPVGWGLRDDMFNKIRSLKKAINEKAGGVNKANFIVAGDFNSMGMNYTYGDHDVTSEEEIERMKKMAASGNYKMKLLSKSHDYSYYNGRNSGLLGNLDHVFASDHLAFKKFNDKNVKVCGLTKNALGSDETEQWIKDFSDHAYLYFELQKSE
ncbi:MAG: endonuclease/exonuclease/phosphatase family protein [Bacteroidales bacterium]|nr:endonuclease/exonuclease/phosphatase family protein [Bacteroidales bacterium]